MMAVSGMQTVINHKMSGFDDRWLGAGWSAWEPSSRTRWAGQVFTLNLGAPQDRGPYVSRLSMSCWVPAQNTEGGADFYVNRVKVARVDDAYSRAAANQPLLFTFWTFGGPLEVTVVFDRPMPPSDPRDLRSLSVIVVDFALACAR
jgi:hypothetical protein